MQCCSAVENKTLLFAATWMDLEIIILRQVSQKGKDISYDIIYVCNLKKWCKWTYLQNRNSLTDLENKLMVMKEESSGRDKLGVWD